MNLLTYQTLYIFREDDAKAWITFKKRGQAGIHSHLVSEGESNEGEPFNISCEENEFQLTKITNKSLELSHSEASNIQFKIIRAEKVFKSIHNKNVSMNIIYFKSERWRLIFLILPYCSLTNYVITFLSYVL